MKTEDIIVHPSKRALRANLLKQGAIEVGPAPRGRWIWDAERRLLLSENPIAAARQIAFFESPASRLRLWISARLESLARSIHPKLPRTL